MPYIKQEDRDLVDIHVDTLLVRLLDVKSDKRAGLFTYIVYRLLKASFCDKYWQRALGIGCLVCAILEIYRREHSKYEDEKITQNGDVG